MPSAPAAFDTSITGIQPQYGFYAPSCIYGGTKIAMTANSSYASGKRGPVLKFNGSGTVQKSPTTPVFSYLSAQSWIFAYDYSGDSGSTQDIVRLNSTFTPCQQRANAQLNIALWPGGALNVYNAPNDSCRPGGVSGATGFVGMVVAWSASENALRAYNNGVALSLTLNNGSGSLNSPLGPTINPICWGGSEGDTEQSSTASLYFAVPLFRSLRDNEARYYSLNPFAVFAAPRRTWAINSIAAAVVKGSTLPMMGVG